MSERYFAYGSNLWIDQMIRRTGPIREGDDRPRVAHLANHRVAFNMYSGDQIYANLVSPGNGVYGVVYTCTPEALAIMDGFEAGYDRGIVRVTLENGEELEVIAYFADSEHAGPDGRPSDEYLGRILKGARQQGLPPDYIRDLESNQNPDLKTG